LEALASKKLKDPSHVSALTPDEFVEMADDLNLMDPTRIEQIRNLYKADIGKDELGVGVYLDGDEVCFHYPSIILTGTKSA
jgi:hypothetical protein